MYLKIKQIFIASIFITIALLFFSCNSDIDIPSYIYIEDVNFSISDKETQGTASHSVPFVFVTADGTDIGCYQLPALIPVIASGQTNIRIGSGIKLNGLSAQRVEYPFYTVSNHSATLTKEKVDTIRPSSTYINAAQFHFIDNFEEQTVFSSVEGASLHIGNDDDLRFKYPNEYNGKYGIITISPEDSLPYFEIKSPTITNLPIDCFVELNYWFTEDVEVGIYCYTSSSQYKSKKIGIANIRASDTKEGETWKKIYINLIDEINNESGSGGIDMDSFAVYFIGSASSGENARFLFDNIKLIYR
jgi:hypothetical protein